MATITEYRDLPHLLQTVREAKDESMEQAAVHIGTNRVTYRTWEVDGIPPKKVGWIDNIADWSGEDYLTIYRAMRNTPDYRERTRPYLTAA